MSQPSAQAVKKSKHLLKGNSVAILDAGAQYGMDIEQQAKRLGHEADRLPFNTPIETLYSYGAIILSGGPESVYDPEAPQPDPRLFTVRDGRPPILGICYGEQLINHRLGGKVAKLERREDGYTTIRFSGKPTLAGSVGTSAHVIMSHGDTVTEVAPGFTAIAYSGDLIAGIANEDKQIYGVQFHPEVSPPDGTEIIRAYLQDVAKLQVTYTYSDEDFIHDAIREVQDFVGQRQVLAFVSGGVDSSALAKLLERALPAEQLSLVLVDHGFMREGEIESVKAMLTDSGVHITVYNAASDFRQATTIIDGKQSLPLDQVADPEVKRKIIGDCFITVQEQMATSLGLDNNTYILAMGSLYTDLIESGSAVVSDKAGTIKTHHNDTELVRNMRAAGRVLEPWRFIQKDNVRAVGKLLGLSEAIYNRQPFPGPGIAIRIICGDQPYSTADSPQIRKQLEAYGTNDIRATLLPIRTVGVQGDGRTYAHLAGLTGARDWRTLKSLADEIPRAVHGVNRVVYIFGEVQDDNATQITPTYLTDAVLRLQKRVDVIVNQTLGSYKLDKVFAQVPVVLTGLNFGQDGKRSVAIRTFKTDNFKTGDAAIPGVDFPEEVLLEIVTKLQVLPDVAAVLYDLTSKPPATTEWE